MTLLPSSGCYNKIPQTRLLINNRNLFLTVPETGSSRSVCQPGQFLVIAFFQVIDFQLL